ARASAPPGAPGWRRIQPDAPRKTGGIAECKVDAEQNSLTARARLRQQFAEQTLRSVACVRIFDQTLRAVVADGANPDAVAAGLRLARRAPIDNHKGVEHPELSDARAGDRDRA